MREIRRKAHGQPAYEPKNDASAKFSASRALTAALLRCRAGRRPLPNRTPSALFRKCFRRIRMPSGPSVCELAASAVRTERKVHQATERIGFFRLDSCT